MAAASGADDRSAWERDQSDADNWLVIPDFGVRPLDVRFEGFAFPIVTPETGDDEFVADLREMVRAVRRLARSEFQSLGELQAANLAAWDLLRPTLMGDESPRDGQAHELLGSKQVAALRYFVATEALKRAHFSWHEARHDGTAKRREAAYGQAAVSFAAGAGMVVSWLTGRPFSRDLEVVQRMRQGASAGGIASGAVRRGQSKMPTPSELRSQRDNLIADGRDARGVAAILATRHGCSADYVRKTLKRD